VCPHPRCASRVDIVLSRLIAATEIEFRELLNWCRFGGLDVRLDERSTVVDAWMTTKKTAVDRILLDDARVMIYLDHMNSFLEGNVAFLQLKHVDCQLAD